MPTESKQDFLEAIKTAPDLVHRESDPVWFLRREEFNPWAAARRLVRYWEGRKQVFGERWLLPLTTDSGGALDDEALVILRKGFLALCGPKDFSQGPVVFLDRSDEKEVASATRSRISFFIVNAIASCADSQTKGVTAIETSPPPTAGLSTKRLREARLNYTLVRDAFPVKIKQILHLEREVGEKGSIVTAFQNCQAKALSAVFGVHLLQPLRVREYSETAQALEDHHGISRNCVPISHGGLWTFDKILEWEAISQKAGTASANASLLAPELKKAAVSKLHKIDDGAESEDDAAKEAIHVKASNAFYARRSYQKKMLKQRQTEEESQRLRTEHAALVNETIRLQTLMYQAGQIVAMVESYEPYPYGHMG